MNAWVVYVGGTSFFLDGRSVELQYTIIIFINFMVPLISDIIPEWRGMFETSYATPIPDLYLPRRNIYLVDENFTYEKCWPRDKVSFPVLLIDSPGEGRLYHEPHHNYGLPNVDVRFCFQLEDTPQHRNPRL